MGTTSCEPVVLGDWMRLLVLSGANQFSENFKKSSEPAASVVVCDSLESVPAVLKDGEFDAALCDEKYFDRLRTRFANPILLVAQSSAKEWVHLLKEGADGIIFHEHAAEALYIVKAFLRRLSQAGKTQRQLPRFGMVIDLENYSVEVKDRPLDLTLTELKVLKEMAHEDDRVIARAQIQKQVFGQLPPGNRSLDVHVCSLRKKIRPHGLDVESVRGVGYRLVNWSKKPASK